MVHQSNPPKERVDTPRSWRKPIMVAAIIVTVWITSRFIPFLDWWPQIMQWIHGLGLLGPFVFILFQVIGTILFVPAIVFGIGAAWVYGFWQAVAITLVSTAISAMVVFYISRYWARGWVARRTAANPKYAAIDEAVGRQGWKIVLLTRLSPGFPFTLLNYALGVTRVTPSAFFFGTAVGMAPRTMVHVYAGVFGSSLASLGVEDAGPSVVNMIMIAVGAVVTILATVYIARIVRKTLEEEPAILELEPEDAAAAQAPEMAVQSAD
jgi:uncharacterized membrane protein YdjX (TVP38/TMEM64 family)